MEWPLTCPLDNCLLHFHLSGEYFGCPGQPDKCLFRTLSVSTPICQEGQSDRTFCLSSQFCPLFSQFFLILSLFFPILGKFFAVKGALCHPCSPPPRSYATVSHRITYQITRKLHHTILQLRINAMYFNVKRVSLDIVLYCFCLYLDTPCKIRHKYQ